MRHALKRSAEKLLVGSGMARLHRTCRRGERLVLGYHNVVGDEAPPAGDRSLHLPRSRFAEQLDHLLRDHRVVPLEQVLDERTNERDPDRITVAITFDDAYRGAVTAGVEELAKRHLPATIFVSPSLLGGRSFWWDALSSREGPVPPPAREKAIHRLAGDASSILAWARTEGLAATEPPKELRSATMGELRRAEKVAGITLGSHSWSHRTLTSLPEEELRQELEKPLRWLRRHFDSVVPWLAYPYGVCSPGVRDATEAAGYEAAVTIRGGRMSGSEESAFEVPRVTVPAGLSIEGFELRTAGVLS